MPRWKGRGLSTGFCGTKACTPYGAMPRRKTTLRTVYRGGRRFYRRASRRGGTCEGGRGMRVKGAFSTSFSSVDYKLSLPYKGKALRLLDVPLSMCTRGGEFRNGI
ncbi:hypothetical protein DQ04_08721010 [Trypanosoma grayi]|uniref:hypothetical protein n=1 Tax=Trypanosoma grayi TaxID=71804 RepID=UPI0004F42167|nr:hypothetical protein DQ04_08721010 [Trypanosoma grayi]KEG07826.1 hypothetical protein DQ04_08721010 [Trypanosoma grayi]